MPDALPHSYRHRERLARQQAIQQTDGSSSLRGSVFHADAFLLDLREGWKNETVYVLQGPEADELQHLIQINVDPDAGPIAVIDYADMQIDLQLNTLRGYQLLNKCFTTLDAGHRAYRALSVWYPTEDRRLYQDQFFVVHDEAGYRLSTCYTKKTRKTLGPQIERAMRSFEPHFPFRLRRAR
jgi:hypothetical protein